MKRFYMSLLLVFGASQASVSRAQELNIETRYSFEALDRFWKNVLVEDASTATNAYRSILTALNAVPKESRNRQEGVWETAPQQTQPIAFFIEPIPSAYAALVAKREMALHMYMIRQEKYQLPNDPVNPLELIQQKTRLREDQINLAVRRKQAGFELFMIKILRYRESDSLEAKCSYLKEAETFYNFADAQQISDRSRLVSVQSLLDLSTSTRTDYDKELLDKKVCQSKKVAGRIEALKNAEKSLNTKIVSSLQREYAQSIDPIATTLKEKFDPLLELIYTIDPLTGDLLEFESLESRAKANIDLVATDSFGLQSLFPKLDAINFDAIKKTATASFIPQAIQEVLTEQDNLVKATRRFLANLNRIAETVPAAQKQNFAICSGLDKQFDGTLPKGIATKDFANKNYPPFGDTVLLVKNMSSCLTLTQNYLKTLQTRDASQQMIDEFASRLEALSREMLHIAN